MNEKAYYLHYRDNGNTWGRIAMLFNLYWPGMKEGFITYALFPFLAYTVAIIAKLYTDHSFKWLLEGPLVGILCLSPMLLTKKDYRQVCEQLPVSRGEKFGFLLLTFFIVVPLIMQASLKFGHLLCKALFHTSIPVHFFNIAKTASKMGLVVPDSFSALLLMVCAISVVLYWVVKAKGNRPMVAILSFFALMFFLMFMAMLAEYMELYHGRLGLSEDGYFLFTTIFYNVLYIIIACLFLVKLYKLLRNSGF